MTLIRLFVVVIFAITVGCRQRGEQSITPTDTAEIFDLVLTDIAGDSDAPSRDFALLHDCEFGEKWPKLADMEHFSAMSCEEFNRSDGRVSGLQLNKAAYSVAGATGDDEVRIFVGVIPSSNERAMGSNVMYVLQRPKGKWTIVLRHWKT